MTKSPLFLAHLILLSRFRQMNFMNTSLALGLSVLIAGPVYAATNTKTTSAPASQHPGNPIRPYDTADPGVVRANGKWYVYHTSSGRSNRARYPIVVSDGNNITDWDVVGHIFPLGHIPKWCEESWSWWAPEVHKVNNRYIAYYTARQNGSNRFAIGAAIASKPEGPFKDMGAPIKKNEAVGLIDVSFFQDPTTRKKYLIWKEDQNDFNPPRPTPLVMQELGSDGITLIGNSRELLRNDQPWEGVLVEAPNIVFHDGWYYLFYSGNIFTSDEYSVGVARSRSVWGPYEKDPKPILVHDENFSGPAHQYVIQDEKGTWHIFYHARLKSIDSGRRFLMHDLLSWGADGWPHVNDNHPGPLSEEMKAEIIALQEAYEDERDRRTKKNTETTTNAVKRAN